MPMVRIRGQVCLRRLYSTRVTKISGKHKTYAGEKGGVRSETLTDWSHASLIPRRGTSLVGPQTLSDGVLDQSACIYDTTKTSN